MALPGGKGLPYFPLDTELDDKFELIEAEFGLTGFAVIIKLFQRIYAKGFYCEWTEEVALLFAKRLGMGGSAVSSGISSGVPSLSAGGDGVLKKKEVAPLFACAGGGVVSEIVWASIKRGIFDEEMFKKYSILTSKGIQERYFDATKRRKHFEIDGAYLLVSDDKIPNNVYINSENVDIKPKNVDINKQRRGEERRGEESIEDKSSCRNSPDGESDEREGFIKNAMLAAEYMAKQIAKHTPNFPQIVNGKKEDTIKRWAKDIELLLRIDKVDFGDFKRVLQFSQTDPFWQTNILSGKKLRAQYGALLVRLNDNEQ